MPSLNIVILGHYKAGKSSLLGSIIYSEIGLDLHKLQRDSSKAGYDGSYLAWSVDTLPEEKKFGCTVQNSFFSVKKNQIFNFFDTPGRSDCINEVISGTVIGDISIIVVDTSIREHIQEKVLNPTKELGYLCRALGISSIIIYLSKIDLVAQNPLKIQETREKVADIMIKIGFKQENIEFINGNSLDSSNGTRVLESIKPVTRTLGDELKPFRLMVDDFYRLVHGKLLGYCVCGYIASGVLKTGDVILITQAKVQAKVKEIMKSNEKVKKAMSGDWVDVTLTEIEGDFNNISRGYIITQTEYPPMICTKLRIRGIANDVSIPILKNQEITLSIGFAHTQATIIKILKQITGKEIKNNPRHLKSKNIGEIDVKCHNPIPLEKFKTVNRLGRCTITSSNKVIFSGMVTEVLE